MQPLWRFLKKLKTGLPYDSAVSLLVIYLKKMKTLDWKRLSAPPCSTEAIAKIQKQPKCPLMGEWIEKTCIYIHTHWNNTQPKRKKGNPVICTNIINLEGIMLNIKWDRYHLISLNVCNLTQKPFSPFKTELVDTNWWLSEMGNGKNGWRVARRYKL